MQFGRELGADVMAYEVIMPLQWFNWQHAYHVILVQLCTLPNYYYTFNVRGREQRPDCNRRILCQQPYHDKSSCQLYRLWLSPAP